MLFLPYSHGTLQTLYRSLCVDNEQFEAILKATCDELTSEVRTGTVAENSGDFEEQVRRVLADQLRKHGAGQALDPKVQGFPDIVVGNYGVEVKFTVKDTWISIANSIHESHRMSGIDCIYVAFGKMGGLKEVRFGLYEKVVYHARTSHRPRFQIDMKGDKQSLFERLGTTYLQFAALPYKEKMVYMRTYARGRRNTNIDFWWLEEDLVPYSSLTESEQRQIKAEAALLIPALIDRSDKNALVRMALYMSSAKRVLSNESSEVFGADVLDELRSLETELQIAASTMIQGIIEEYWGHSTLIEARLSEWVEALDNHSTSSEVRPSQILFGGRYAKPAR
jgi:hypothetical protein